jgi:hypothetical protein
MDPLRETSAEFRSCDLAGDVVDARDELLLEPDALAVELLNEDTRNAVPRPTLNVRCDDDRAFV